MRRDELPHPGMVMPRILFMLFAAGWAANHFTSLIPVLRGSGRYPEGSLEVAFGLYALGLLPSLLGGGALADRHPPRRLALIGTAVAATGNLCLLLVPVPLVTDGARFIIGIGVGLAISAGNAWASRVQSGGGAALAGTVLTAGFGIGPLITGIIAVLAPASLSIAAPVLLTLALSCASGVLLVTMRDSATGSGASHPATTHPRAAEVAPGRHSGIGPALRRSVPMALWVFSSVTVTIVTLAGRLEAAFSGPFAAGLLAFVLLGTGALTQIVARRRAAGPRAGIIGAVLAAVGFTIAAFAEAPTPPLVAVGCALIFGLAYGLCLRTGLTDVEHLAPPASRGLVGGIFYVMTYIGFGLPALLVAVTPLAGGIVPLLVVAALAAATALLRAGQLRSSR